MVWILLIFAVIWAIVAQSSISKFKAENIQLANAIKGNDKFKKDLAVQSFNYDLLVKHLIRAHGAKEAAQIHLANIQNAPKATDAIEAFYEAYGLPKQYATEVGFYTYESLHRDHKDRNWKDNRAKYEKMLLRNMIADYENIEDDMKSYDKRMKEIENQSEY